MSQKHEKPSSYRDILQRELDLRARRNPKYTLRAFARDLEISPSQLSEILTGKHGLSTEKALAFAKTLRLAPKETKFFRDSVESFHGRSLIIREAAKARMLQSELDPNYHQITLDHFAIISDWYHFAILKLLDLDNAKSDVEWISTNLGIESDVTALAIERLVRVGLLENLEGALKPVEDYVGTPTDIPSEAIKHFHTQILELAKQRLYSDPVQLRDFFVTLMPIDKEQLPEIKVEINDFHNKINRLTSQSKSKNTVYCLASQFFALTQLKEVQS